MTEKYSVPANSLGELIKIVEGYASSPSEMSLADVSKATGMNPTTISGNARFLVDLGMIRGGKSKQATDLGRKYARAKEHKQDEVAKKILVEAIKLSEFLSGLVSTVRIRRGMTLEEFGKHVLYVADQRNTGKNRTGSRTIADLLVESGMLQENDGKLGIVTMPSVEEDHEQGEEKNSVTEAVHATEERPETKKVYEYSRSRQPSVTINVTLQIPEVDDPVVYDRFFKAMKENLFPDG